MNGYLFSISAISIKKAALDKNPGRRVGVPLLLNFALIALEQ